MRAEQTNKEHSRGLEVPDNKARARHKPTMHLALSVHTRSLCYHLLTTPDTAIIFVGTWHPGLALLSNSCTWNSRQIQMSPSNRSRCQVKLTATFDPFQVADTSLSTEGVESGMHVTKHRWKLTWAETCQKCGWKHNLTLLVPDLELNSDLFGLFDHLNKHEEGNNTPLDTRYNVS